MMILLMVVHDPSAGDSALVDRIADYGLKIGLGFSSTDFDVYTEGSMDPNGTFSEDFTWFPYLTLVSPYRYFGETRAGGMMEYKISGFRLSRQLVGDDLVDLGSSLSGSYAFVTPTLFYSFTGRNASVTLGQSLIIGIGVGIGYLRANGDIVFTETTGQRFNINISGMAIAVSGFVEYRIHGFELRVYSGLVSHTEGGYDYDAFGFGVNAGYVFGL